MDVRRGDIPQEGGPRAHQADATDDQAAAADAQPLTTTQPLPAIQPLAGSSLPLAFPGLPQVGSPQNAESALSGAGESLRRPLGRRDLGGWLGDVAGAVAARSRATGTLFVRAAHDRAVSPNSVIGVGLLLGLCGAAWFSGGTRQDSVFALAMLGAWAIARTGAWYLAAATGQWDQPKQKLVTRAAVGFGWFFAVTTTAAECAVYGGIAAGAEAAGWTGTWSLAVIAVILASVGGVARRLVPRGQDWPEAADRERSGGAPSKAGVIGGRLGSLISVPPSIKLLLAGMLMVGYGPRIALFAVSVIGAVSLIGSLVRLATGPVRRDMVLIARDDGPLARWAGRLVRGNLVPLPPVLVGVLGICLLASLGMRHLPGVVALTPVVVLLLAAPGSSNRHDRRLDWLVPLLLCLSQYVYIAALGSARSVPGPVVFATCSMIAIWYTSLVAGQAPKTPVTPTRGDDIGWEGRVTIIALAAMFGIATFGYLGLAACLAALLCRKAARGYRPYAG